MFSDSPWLCLSIPFGSSKTSLTKLSVASSSWTRKQHRPPPVSVQSRARATLPVRHTRTYCYRVPYALNTGYQPYSRRVLVDGSSVCLRQTRPAACTRRRGGVGAAAQSQPGRTPALEASLRASQGLASAASTVVGPWKSAPEVSIPRQPLSQTQGHPCAL